MKIVLLIIIYLIGMIHTYKILHSSYDKESGVLNALVIAILVLLWPFTLAIETLLENDSE